MVHQLGIEMGIVASLLPGMLGKGSALGPQVIDVAAHGGQVGVLLASDSHLVLLVGL